MTTCCDPAVVSAAVGARVDVLVKKGVDANPITVKLLNADGSATDLTGATVTAHVRKLITDSAAVATWVVTIAANVVTMKLPAASQTSLVAGNNANDKAGAHVWSAVITFANGEKRELVQGAMQVVLSETR